MDRVDRELRVVSRRFGLLLAALLALVLVGAISFSLVEGVSLGYGFVWTLDTITTLGTVPAPRNVGGRLIVIGLELLGIGTLFYGLATVAEFFLSGQLSGVLAARRTHRMIESLSEHYIVCGYGRVGRVVARDLRAHDAPVVVVDSNPDHRLRAESERVPYVLGEVAEDEVLLAAGIMRAAGVVACVDSDAENIFVTLSARGLRSDILIIARASAEDTERKLVRAGANRVISPYTTTGSEMARIALHPQIAGGVAVADFRVEQIEVPAECRGRDRAIAEIRGACVIVALRRAGGELEPQPDPQTVVRAGDSLTALGTPDALERLEANFQPAGAPAA